MVIQESATEAPPRRRRISAPDLGVVVAWLWAGFIAVVAFAVYVHRYEYPPALFWDENYHIASAQKYLNGVFYMEPNPTLGKLLLARGDARLHTAVLQRAHHSRVLARLQVAKLAGWSSHGGRAVRTRVRVRHPDEGVRPRVGAAHTCVAGACLAARSCLAQLLPVRRAAISAHLHPGLAGPLRPGNTGRTQPAKRRVL